MVSRRQRFNSLTSALAVLALSAIGALTTPTTARAAVTGGAYSPLAPSRILDTRDGTGGLPIQPLGPRQTIDVQVSGQGNVPSTATAAVLNVTVTNTTAASYLTVYPAGASQPIASNLNWVAGQTIPNLVEVGLGIGGKVTVYNAQGLVDVIFDVAGYVDPSLPPGQGLYQPLVPARILDTRNGTGGVPVGPVGQGATLILKVTGGTVPSAAAGVILNVTVTNATAASYLTVYPSDQPQPVVSNLNFAGGQTIPNRVIVKLSADGKVTFYNARGSVDVLADIGGWFSDGTNPTAPGSTFVPLTPSRILDTRDGTGGFPISAMGPQQAIPVKVAGRGGVPLMTDAAPPNAVVANVTATGGSEASYSTLWPDGDTQPVASDLNWSAGVTIPNLVVVKLGGSGVADLFNAAGCAHVIVDVVGYYTGPALPASATALTRIPNCPPVERAGASLAYDAAHHVAVLFGGVSSRGVMNDTWTWDGANWTMRNPTPSPSIRELAGMAPDTLGRVVLFGGLNNTADLGDTWTLAPEVSAMPGSGLPGAAVTVNGLGFSARKKVAVAYDSALQGSSGVLTTVCTATVRSNGSFRCAGHIPTGTNAGPTGPHDVTATDTGAMQSANTFVLT